MTDQHAIRRATTAAWVSTDLWRIKGAVDRLLAAIADDEEHVRYAVTVHPDGHRGYGESNTWRAASDLAGIITVPFTPGDAA